MTPTRLDQITGLEAVTSPLTEAVKSGRVSHAYVLSGAAGAGKRTVALAFARSLLCAAPKNGLPCENCPACVKSAKSAHPDLAFVSGSGASGRVSVEAIRALKADIYIKPGDSDRKVYVIKDLPTVRTEAQNALLKVFEEPPEYATIIILCESEQELLPTILSRAVTIALAPRPKQAITDILEREYQNRDRFTLLKAAEAADGNLGRAKLFVEDDEFADKLTTAREILAKCSGSSFYDLITLTPRLCKGKDTIDGVLSLLAALLRESETGGELTNEARVAIMSILNDYKRKKELNVGANLSALAFLISCWEAAH